MLAPYLAVLRTPGALAFSAAAFVGRLPISMVGLGMVLLVSARTGSYGLAGAVSAVYLLVNSVAAPLQARFADRHGQAALLWPAVTAQAVGIALFLAAAREDPTLWQLYAAAALVGASLPQIGSLVRARWAALHTGTALLHTAYALESVLDELIFVLGPVVVTLLATQVHPYAGLGTTLLLTVGGGVALALLRGTEPPRGLGRAGPRPPMPVGELAGLVLGFTVLGAVFGAIDVAVVAAADAAGRRPAAGAVLASFAAGSLVAGVVWGSVHWRSAIRTRLVLTHTALAVAVVPLPLLDGLAALAAFATLAGLTISPTLITGFSLIEEVVPAARLTEGLAWVSTALGVGVAVGATLSGRVADASGAGAAFWVPVVAAALAVVPAAAAAALRRRRPVLSARPGARASAQ